MIYSMLWRCSQKFPTIKQTNKNNAKTRGITHHRTTVHCRTATNPLMIHIKMPAAATRKQTAAIVAFGSTILPISQPVCQPKEIATIPTIMRIMAPNKDQSDKCADRGHRVWSSKWFFVSCLSFSSSICDKSSVMGYFWFLSKIKKKTNNDISLAMNNNHGHLV